MSNGLMLAAPRKAHWTLLLPEPRDYGQVPACPRKVHETVLQQRFRDYGHQASPSTTLFQHQRTWPFSGVCWDQVVSTVSTKMSFQQWNRFSPCGPRPSRTPLLLWPLLSETLAQRGGTGQSRSPSQVRGQGKQPHLRQKSGERYCLGSGHGE